MTNNPAIEVADLRIEYGRTTAVADISFDVATGEVFALLGTNGAGKTTTLDVLEGYRAPTAGNVRVLGMDPFTQRDTLAPSLGIMLQDAGFFDTLTVRQTLKAWRRFYREPRSLEDSVDLVGLGHRVSTRVGSLSGGERRRLDLALALLGRPSLLFLDEPTTGMDPEGRKQSLAVVADMVRDGLTVVLTTHYLEEAEQLADRVAIMHRGTIRQIGSMDEVLGGAGDARIAFEIPSDLVPDLPRTLAPTATDRHGTSVVKVRTADQEQAVRQLLAWGDAHRIPLANLEIRRSSLEDVFLNLAEHEASGQPTSSPSDLVTAGV